MATITDISELLLIDKAGTKRTFAEQIATAAIVKALTYPNRRIRPDGTYVLFNTQFVTAFLNNVFIDAKIDGREALRTLHDSYSSGLKHCKRLILFVNKLSSGFSTANYDDLVPKVFGNKMAYFSLRCSQHFTELGREPDVDMFTFCLRGLALCKNTLTHLTLTHTDLGFTETADTLVLLMEGVLKDNFVLSVLDLSHNYIKDAHIYKLVEVLKTCYALTCLDLAGNMLTAASVDEFAKNGPFLLELNFGTLSGTQQLRALPRAALTLNVNDYSQPLPPNTLLMMENMTDVVYNDEKPTEWMFNSAIYFEDRFLQGMPRKELVETVMLVVYNDAIAKRFSSALLTPHALKMFPNIKKVVVFGCDATSSGAVVQAPTHSCLRQNNTHVIIDDIPDARTPTRLLHVIVAGANMPIGEDMFKNNRPVDDLADPELLGYETFWTHIGLWMHDEPLRHRFTTTVTLLTTNPAQGSPFRFVLKNKVHMLLEIYRDEQYFPPDNHPYKGKVTLTFVPPCASETQLFATTNDPHILQLLKHVLLSQPLKEGLMRAGVALAVN